MNIKKDINSLNYERLTEKLYFVFEINIMEINLLTDETIMTIIKCRIKQNK